MFEKKRDSAAYPQTVFIVGRSNSGKTTLVTSLISELKRRGFKVAAVKHGHHSGEFDRTGKDSWRMADAGADAIGYLSPGNLLWMYCLPTNFPLKRHTGNRLHRFRIESSAGVILKR